MRFKFIRGSGFRKAPSARPCRWGNPSPKPSWVPKLLTKAWLISVTGCKRESNRGAADERAYFERHISSNFSRRLKVLVFFFSHDFRKPLSARGWRRPEVRLGAEWGRNSMGRWRRPKPTIKLSASLDRSRCTWCPSTGPRWSRSSPIKTQDFLNC